MYLTISDAGTPVWRIKYRVKGAERTYTIGAYPGVGLKAARLERARVKALLREGRDPVQDRRIKRIETTNASGNAFRGVAEAWLEKERKDWSAVHYKKSKHALERDVFPVLGPLPVSDITPHMITKVVEAIAGRGVRETAAKILQHVTAIFSLAQARGLRTDNPALPAQEVLPKAKRAKGRPALLTFPALGNVLRSAEAARLSPAVRMAHRLCAFAPGARISNIVEAEWPEFDIDGKTPMWVIPRRKMKAQDRDHDHKIVLAPAFVAELRKWRSVVGGNGYLFPSPAGGMHITRESLEKAYRVTLGLDDKHTPHGWRAAFSTLAKDSGADRDVVELVLDHIHDNDVVRAYDRGERLEHRIKLMTWWTDELVNAQRGAQVVPLRISSKANA
jgi:integrase